MELKIKKFDDKAVIPFKAYDKDFCYDLVAVSEEEIAPNVWKYRLGWGCQIKRGDELITEEHEVDFGQKEILVKPKFFKTIGSPLNFSIDIRPRSSIWKTGMVLSNSVGTVDEGYTNEISAIFYHVLPNMPRYKVGDKVCQAKIGITFPITFREVDELSETERGTKGYGSSGK